MVEVGERTLVPEHILPVVGPERPAIFPLGVSLAGAAAHHNPAAFADRLARFDKGLTEPGNDPRGFGLGPSLGHVIVGKGNIERVLPRDEGGRQITAAGARVGIVVAAEVARPLDIPRAFAIRNRIVLRRLLADPEDGGDNIVFPRMGARIARPRPRLDRRSRDAGFDPQKHALPQTQGLILERSRGLGAGGQGGQKKSGQRCPQEEIGIPHGWNW